MGFTAEEYVYEHNVEFRTMLMERLKSENLQGLCVAWTIDWLKHNLMHEPINNIYSSGQIDQLIAKHKDYIVGRELEKYSTKEGVTLQRIAGGEISYWGGLKEFDNLDLQPGCGYLVQIGEHYSSMRDTFGHVFALFREESAVLFFDQNYGMVRVTNFSRINEEYKKEVQLFEDELHLKLRNWEIYQVTLTG